MFLAALLIASDARAGAVRKDGLEALVKLLEADAEAWVKEEPLTDEAGKKLKAVAYDSESLPALKAALAGTYSKQLVQMYVASKLLEPMLRAKTEVVRQAMPTVRQVHARAGRYKKFRRHSKSALRKYKIPKFKKGVSAQARMNQMAKVLRRRESKRLKELAILQHNHLVHEVEKLHCQLMATANQRQYDELLVRKLIQCEDRKDWFFAEVSDIIARRVAKMDKQRAKFFYDKLDGPARKLRYAKKTYIDRGKAIIRPAANSGFRQVKLQMTGRRLLGLLNALAKRAGMPAVKVPSRSDVDKYQRKKREEARKKRGK